MDEGVFGGEGVLCWILNFKLLCVVCVCVFFPLFFLVSSCLCLSALLQSTLPPKTKRYAFK